MFVNGFNFNAKPLPPSSGEMAQAWRPYVDACIEFRRQPLHVRKQLPGRQGARAAIRCCSTRSNGSRAAPQRRRSPICSPAPRRGSTGWAFKPTPSIISGVWRWTAAVTTTLRRINPRSGGWPCAGRGRCWPGRWGPRGSTEAARTAETASAALDVLRNHFPSMSIHMAGEIRHYLESTAERRSRERDARGIAWRSRALRTCRTAPSSAGIPEGSLAVVRTPEPGQLFRHHLDRLAWMDELVASHGVGHALCTADLEAPHKAPRSSLTWKVSTSSTASSNG